MALTFKKVTFGFLKLPGTILSGLWALAFGFTEKDSKGESTRRRHGLFSLLLAGIMATGLFFSNLIAKHINAIATAFWLSAIAAGAAALTVAVFWPAALAALISFPVFGYTLAALTSNVAVQITAIALVAALATSVVTYITAGIVNGISALIKANACCSSATDAKAGEDTAGKPAAAPTKDSAPKALSKLGGPDPKDETPYMDVFTPAKKTNPVTMTKETEKESEYEAAPATP